MAYEENERYFTDLRGAAQELAKFGSITELSLKACERLTNVNGLKSLTTLRRLDLSICSQLTNVDGLKGLTALREVSLDYCERLTSVDGLKGLTALKYLNLCGCTALVSLDALKSLTGLERLDLTESSLTDHEVEHLRAALPSLSIHYSSPVIQEPTESPNQ